ncbi:hypothetical protein PROFUN_03013 [Planoprotostelium fungivorum]|uniref:EamA domain-containing protein n=1 Tax=Planoprotostelium fungivorum TaxID=1890364 RepID=A0A2P6NXB5_9EUKA|nr:hypothetical protein PROFUN_03013 [Planoprotostelium fungivorum]
MITTWLHSHPVFTLSWSLIFWAFVNVASILVTKPINHAFDFEYPVIILLWQNVFTLSFLAFLDTIHCISYKELRTDMIAMWLPVSINSVAVCLSEYYTGFLLKSSAVSFFRHIGTLFTIYLEAHTTWQPLLRTTTISCVMIGICALSLLITSSLNVSGSIIAITNCIIGSTFLIFTKQMIMRDSSTRNHFDVWTMTYYNSVFSILLLLPLAFFMGEFRTLGVDLIIRRGDNVFVLLMIILGFLSFFRATSTFWVIKRTDASNLAIVSLLLHIPISLIGVIEFNVMPTAAWIISVILGLLAGVVYSCGWMVRGGPVIVDEEQKGKAQKK